MSDAERTMMFQLPNQLAGKLICVGGTMAGRTFELSGGTFTIGRASDSDLCLVDEPGVSKQHAKIVGQGASYSVVDCESRNGTFVNNEAVSPHRTLSDGDELRICGCILRLQQTGVGPPRAPSSNVVPRTSNVTAPFMAINTLEAEERNYDESPPATIPPDEEAAPVSSRGPTLAAWFAAGLTAMLVVGGGAFMFLGPDEPKAKTDPTVALATTTPANAIAPVPVPLPVVPVPVAPVAPAPVAPQAAPPVELAAINDDADDAGDTTSPAARRPARKRLAAKEKEATEPAEPPTAVAATEPEAPVEPAAAATPAGPGKSFAATPDVRSETVKTKGAGRVKSVAFADGADVDKGETLVMFDAGASEEEMATLQDRIASLQSAEGEDAQRELKAAKTKLQALLAGAKSPPIISPMAGKLSGFTIQPGQLLKAGDVIGKVLESDAPARVKVTVDKSIKAKAGQGVVLELQTGATAQGSVIAISGKTVFVDTGGSAPEQVARVRFE
jgi:biotin carboxyl carrier protein